MRLAISRQNLARVLGAVGKVVESRNTIPILGNVLLSAVPGQLQVTGTDLDITATASVEADVSEPGRVCVDVKLLADITKKAGADDITIGTDGEKLIVKSGRSRFSLATLPAEDFPTASEAKYDTEFDVDLAALFAPVQFAISTEEVRFYLNGIFFKGEGSKLTAVATDGHRLSRHAVDGDHTFNGIIVPRKTVGVLPRGLVTVAVSENRIRVAAGDFVMVSKLIDGTFPDYDRVIPKANDKKILFGSDDMRQAASRVSVVSSERGRAVKMSFADGEAKLAVSNPDSGSATDEIIVTYDGDPIEIGFNANYLTELVGIFPAGDIQLALADSGSPAVFTSEKAPGLLAVLMPMRV
ncbi:DNA polymerase III subunit beta [Ensifer sp. ENS04]|uniref:DNA polymerase III subunit beta n=1 Tax=Ensifer sp. ENS04 TaxID=2769281 RepID=UPI0017831081|nr:DNA polymerase III subunit beta [Ensifer sp. ENS04]MBD9542917.1 DNA polymerase III subunit beta [Ensifer sp. ENS04]